MSHHSINSTNSAKNSLTTELVRVTGFDHSHQPGFARLEVEAMPKSTCGSCSAQNTCGHGVMHKWFSRKTPKFSVKVATEQLEQIEIGQWVEIGIADDAIIRASWLVYILPLLGLIFGSSLANSLLGAEVYSILGGGIGFFAALAGIHFYQPGLNNDVENKQTGLSKSNYEPILVSIKPVLSEQPLVLR